MAQTKKMVLLMVVSLSLLQYVGGGHSIGRNLGLEGFPASNLDKDCKNIASDSMCAQKKRDGYCTQTLVEYMKVYCRKTCGFCEDEKN